MEIQPRALTNRGACWAAGAALVIFILTLCLSSTPINDLFWQMRTGGNILATHRVPYSDSYSWTRFGTPWIAHEWGMCVLLWLAYHVGAYTGVWLLQAALLVAAFLLLFRRLLGETSLAPLPALLLSFYAAVLTSPLISPRPHLFTYLFLVLMLGLALDYRRHPEQSKQLWWLVPITILWANFHAGVVAGLALCGLLALGDAIEAAAFTRPEDPRQALLVQRARHLIKVTLVCMLAMMVNPYGWRIYEIFGKTVGDPTMPHFVSEWTSLDFHTGYGPAVEGFLALIAFSLAWTRERREVAELLILTVLVAAALSAIRNGPLLGIVGVLLIARHVQSGITGLTEKSPTSMFGSAPPTLMIGLLPVLFAILFFSKFTTAEQAAPAALGSPLQRAVYTAYAVGTFPEKACQFMAAEKFPTSAHLYNDYNNGGYLLWRLPQYPVFICTQTDIYFGRVLQDYARLEKLPFGWREILAPYHPDIIFTSTEDRQAHLFLAAPDWTLVYADHPIMDAVPKGDQEASNALIFVHDVPQYQALITRCLKDRPLPRRQKKRL